jgi:rhodanese-related sulfurtransferase
MAREIGLDELRHALAGGRVQLVEVLPAEVFAWAHLPGARNIPLKHLDASSVGVLDRHDPVIVYCNDSL